MGYEREPLPPDPAARAQRMAEIPGSSMSMIVERSEARQRENPELTISAEALDGLISQMGLWVATRIHRSARAGSPPQKVEVEVDVKLDGVGDSIHETVSFTLPDASHRAGLGPRGSG